MKKLFIAGLLLLTANLVFAGGASETDRFTNPDTIVYFEFANPEKTMQSIDALLKELGLMNLMGISSVKQELIAKIQGINPEYIDFNRPVTAALLSPDKTNLDGITMMIPLKDKKFYSEIEKAYTAKNPQDSILQAGSYVLIASDAELLKNAPFKKPMDLSGLDRKAGHDVAVYVSVENLMKLPTFNEAFIALSMEQMPEMGELPPAFTSLIAGGMNVLKQAESLTLYLDVNGTEISCDMNTAFTGKSKAAEFVHSVVTKEDLPAMISLLPSGYLATYAIQNDKTASLELNKMMLDLFDEKMMPAKTKAALTDFNRKILELVDGPMAAAYHFDYGKLISMSMNMYSMMEMEKIDLIDMMELQVYATGKCTDAKQAMKMYGDYYSSSAFTDYMKLLLEPVYTVKTAYKENEKIQGISFNRLDMTMNMNIPQQEYVEAPSFFIETSIYITGSNGYIYIALGEQALQDVIATINNGGTPVMPFDSNKAVKKTLAKTPGNLVSVGTFSPIMLINSMIKSLTGGMDLGLSSNVENPAGAISYMQIKGNSLNMNAKYEASELKSIITIIGMFMQMGAAGGGFPAN